MADKDLRPKPSPSLKDVRKKKQKAISVEEFKAKTPIPEQEPQYPRSKKIKVKNIEPDIEVISTGSTEGMRDAAKIEGKPHSSLEGQFESKMRSIPLKVVTFKNGGSVRLAKKGGGKAYGKNS